MIAEPYICTNRGNPCYGNIHWLRDDYPSGGDWQPYADFEREKLKRLGKRGKTSHIYAPGDGGQDGWQWTTGYGDSHFSGNLIGYDAKQYFADTESSRLLKRAEFLKAVCEKECIPWLPAPEGWKTLFGASPPCKSTITNATHCSCSDCKKPELEECDRPGECCTYLEHMALRSLVYALQDHVKALERKVAAVESLLP